MSAYREYVIETFRNEGEASSSQVRARLMSGQGIPTIWRVECSKSMRNAHPPGTRFLLLGKPAGGGMERPFLYCNPRADFKVLSEAEALNYIQTNFRGQS